MSSQKKHFTISSKKSPSKNGFTLVELLVVIAIILVLSGFIFSAVKRAKLSAEKTLTMNTFRSLQTGLAAFQVEYSKPPVPDEIITAGTDIVFGAQGSPYPNSFIVAVLEGLGPNDTSVPFNFAGGDWRVEKVNKKLEAYISFPRTQNSKNGVSDLRGNPNELQLFDSWGNQIMIALNIPPFQTDFARGVNDRRCFTDGLGEYAETAPREEDAVFWSYGRDRARGNAGDQSPTPRFKGTDDVISW